jgi:RNA polymerase sigma-70 factor (ECF subfamily)
VPFDPDRSATGTSRFQSLLLPVRTGLYRFALKLTGEAGQADDLFHQAVLVGLSRFDQLAVDGAFRTWMSRIVYHTHLNEQRRRRRGDGPAEPFDETVVAMPSTLPLPDRELDRARIGDRISRALGGLPDAQAQAIWLVDGQGFTYTEAAEILGTARGTVATLVARGRRTLRESLTEYRHLAEDGR